ncbi:uncharacterized protein B0H18DRAFT_979880 [Fomitopsis serialis]|uniref:uncharacterized protein n=1 Tax=Fomitopsis serialis TaxID=139415 RepID=UPI00200859A4|nr:uncharacterized protein B0H18DRAFT_979880 [Neoantrodia serialis]KAH9934191.1 hypothetical protein B0H18DRAFT_979880 [Neoantrodia serialis]
MRAALALAATTAAFLSSFTPVKAGCEILRAQIAGCPQGCWEVADYGSCTPASNSTCLCNEPVFVESVSLCIKSTCTPSEIAQYAVLADQLCATANVTLERRLLEREL